MSSTFDIQTWPSGPCMVVQAAGDLDMAVAPRLRAEIDQVLDGLGHPCLVMDLTQVPFCDSVGLGVLVGTLTRVKEAHGRLVLVVSPGMITHLLTITNLDRHFEMRGSLREALDSFTLSHSSG
ncbi:anti-sigma B factor antagonist [Streptosporangium becharense]|uniref:Anti-sigma factor antagonist n=1 Tax=Streptosporangium becharense TaxID=1816182 RepID=A0A7W9IEQ9_9ACTN|nr:STAS domain-containing protein [Streptosporangium becharense]MBB2909667.1 anti-sigma B factor antagonist [Streptosporangium becharense]MBB5819377.1 anti-sigma B factor antagonist [Streptosporangium becharense]